LSPSGGVGAYSLVVPGLDPGIHLARLLEGLPGIRWEDGASRRARQGRIKTRRGGVLLLS